MKKILLLCQTIFFIFMFNGLNAQYCVPAYTNGCEETGAGVTFFEIYSISEFIPCTGSPSYYQDYTSTTVATNLFRNGYHYVLVQGGTWDMYVSAWIDYNQNNVFENDELIGQFYCNDPNELYTFYASIPETALTGTTRLRVMSARWQYPAGPCSVTETYGNCADFNVIIQEALIPPTVTTMSATGVTTSEAVLHSSVDANGYDTHAQFLYGKTTAYGTTAEGDPDIVSGDSPTDVEAVISGLEPNTTYHYKAVSWGIGGYVSGVDMTYTTDILPPVPITYAASNISGFSAVLNGTINANNISTDIFFQYGLDDTYTEGTIDGTPSNLSGFGDEWVTGAITGLDLNTTYHFRIGCTNSEGTFYGDDMTFTTLETPYCIPVYSIGCTSGRGLVNFELNLISQTIPCTGSPYYFDYTSTTTTDLAQNGYYSISVTPGGTSFLAFRVWIDYNQNSFFDAPVEQVGEGYCSGGSISTIYFTVDGSSLTGPTRLRVMSKYYSSPYSGFPVSSCSTSETYGNCADFTVNIVDPYTPPDVTTTAATDVTSTDAVLNGTVDANDNSTQVEFHYGYDTLYGSIVPGVPSPVTGTDPTDISGSIAGLEPNTEYHFKAVGYGEGGYVSGNDMTFSTDLIPPTVTTFDASSIGGHSAILNGEVNANNSTSTVYFEYGLDTGYDTTVYGNPDTVNWYYNQSVSALITGLDLNTTYHFRIVSINAADTSFGEDKTFTTLSTPYCIPIYSVGCDPDGYGVTYFEIYTIYKNIPCTGTPSYYHDYYDSTLISTNLWKNGYHEVVLQGGNWNTYVTIWIDYNQNNFFDNDEILGQAYLNDPGVYYTFHYTVSPTALTGETRLRVMSSNSWYPDDPCSLTMDYGNCADFRVNINDALTPPTVITTAATSINPYDAVLNAVVNANGFDTHPQFQYGTDISYGNTIEGDPVPVSGSDPTDVTGAISGLDPNTTYHYRAISWGIGGYVEGDDMTFTSSAIPPTVVTGIANNMTATSVTLNGTVNANNSPSTVFFEYGTDLTYGTTIDGTPSIVYGNFDQSVSAIINGLTHFTLYHYRVYSINEADTAFGDDMMFFYSPYCTPSYSDGCETYNIGLTYFELNTISQTITCTGSPSYYHNFMPLSTDLTQGATYSMTVNEGSYDVYYNVWIDYNQNNIFDGASELVGQGYCANGSTSTIDITIPDGTLLGTTGLRVMSNYFYYGYPDDPCGYEYYGNCSDFLVNIVAPVAGAPIATTTGATNVSGISATLNGTVNANFASTTVTFEYGLTDSYGTTVPGVPSPVTGNATQAIAAGIAGLSLNTTYHYRIVATNSEGTSYGDDMTFTTLTTQYCIPVYSTGCSTGRGLVYFELNSISQTIACTGSPSYYHDFTSVSTDLGLNGNYSILVTASSSGRTYTTIWIDYNHNSVFDGTSEIVGQAFTSSGTTSTIPITISGTALTGSTRLRVMARYASPYPTNPCSTTEVYGNCSDFTVNIVPNGAPTVSTKPATSISGNTAVLNGLVNPNGYSSDVSFEYGLTAAYGTTLGGTPSPLSGTTNTPVSAYISGLALNTTYHYRVFSQNSEGTSYGNDMTFTTLTTPYCIPVYSTGCNTYNIGLTSFQLNTINQSITCTGAPNYYHDFTASSTDLYQNGNYSISVVIGYGNVYVTVWIDYNHNNIFDGASEVAGQVYAIYAGQTYTIPITVSTSSLTGSTRLRAMGNYYWPTYNYPDDPCTTTETYGNCSDFTVNLLSPLPPPTVITDAATGITATEAVLNGTFNANGYTTNTSFNWGLSASYGNNIAGVPSTVSGSTNTIVSASLTSLTPNTTYHFQAKAMGVGGTVTGSDLTFSTVAIPPTVTTTAATNIFNTYVTLNGTVNANNSSSSVSFEYGLTTSYGSTKIASPSTVTGYSVVSVTGSLTGLTLNTLYHYRIVSTNSAGTSYGDDMTFTTVNSPYCMPSYSTGCASYGMGLNYFELNTISQTIPCTGSPSWYHDYTLTSSTDLYQNGNYTVSVKAGYQSNYVRVWIDYNHNNVFDVADELAGQVICTSAGTTYTFSITISGSSTTGTTVLRAMTNYGSYPATPCGSYTYGNCQDFAVNILPPLVPPTVTTIAATGVTGTDAVLNGIVNANNYLTNVTFNYGLTTSYGTTVAAVPPTVTGNTDTPVSASLTGLVPNTTYHYQAVGTGIGGTTYGDDMTFTTNMIPPTVTTLAANANSGVAATLNGTVNPNNLTSDVSFEYGLSTSYGTTVTGTPASVSGSTTQSIATIITGLNMNTTYHYRIISTNSAGTSLGNDMTFTTLPTLYCIPVYTSGCSSYTMGLTYFGLNTISQTITCTGTPSYYHDFTSSSTDLAQNGTYTVSVIGGYSYTYARFWIDYNQNNIFDAGESVGTVYCGNPGTTYTGNITISGSALTGSTRLRAMTNYYYNYPNDPCGTYTYGNCSDFTVNIVAPGPPIVYTQAATLVNVSSATLNGLVNANFSSTDVSFDYGLSDSYGSTIAATPSPLTGGVNTAVTGSLTGLPANTTYHYRVVGVNSVGTSLGTDMTFTTTTTTIYNVTGSGSYCSFDPGLTVGLNGSDVGTDYQLYKNTVSYGSSVAGTGSPLSWTNMTDGTYTIIGTTSQGPTTMNGNAVITSFANPVSVSINANTNPVCPGVSVTFTAYPTNGGTTPAYQWQVNNVNVGTNNYQYSYTPNNGDQVKCILTSNIACPTGNPATSNTITMVVGYPNPTITPPTGSICLGSSYTYYTQSGHSGTYNWAISPGNDIIAGGTSNYNYVTLIWNSTGAQWVSVNYSAYGCYAPSPTVYNETVNPLVPVSVEIVVDVNPVCSGLPVTFTATPTNGGTSPYYRWYRGSTNVYNSYSNTYTYTPNDGDVIHCVMTSNASCPSGNPATSNNITMVTNTSFPVSVSIVADGNPVCTGTTVNFTATPVNGGTTPTYQWYKGSTLVGGNSPTYSYIPANGDNIKVVLTSSESCASGSPATSNIVHMTVNPYLPVSVTIAANANPSCEGATVLFTATPVNGGSSPTYQWYNGATAVGGNSPAYSYIPANGDVITCELTSNVPCPTGNPATSNAITMAVNPILPVSVSISTPQTTVCAGTSVTFTAAPVNGGATPSYQWHKGATHVGGNSPTYTYVPVNGDAISVVMTSSLVCKTGSPATSNTITMTVNPVLPVSVSIIADANPVCPGTTVNFTATPVNGGSTPSYQWYKGASPVGSDSPTYSYIPVNGDIIRVVLTSSETCKSGSPASSNIITIVVNPILPVSVTIAADQNPVCESNSVTLTATPVNGGSSPSYQWYLGATPVGGNSPVYSYTPAGGDVLTCVLTSNAVCPSGNPATSNAITIAIDPWPSVTIAGNSTACEGELVTYTASVTDGGTNPAYQWFVNGSPVASGGGAVSNGLIAYYPFFGDANDATGNGNNGTNVGATLTTDRLGISNSAYNFNGGLANRISIPVNLNITALPQMTMLAWVKPTSISPIKTILSHDNGGYDRSLTIDSRGSGTGYSCFRGGYGVLGSFPATAGTWAQVAVKYNQSTNTATLFSNGSSISGSTSFGTGWPYAWIGGNPSFNEYFNGVIDDVRIYNRLLSSDEITALYNDGLKTNGPTFVYTPSDLDQVTCVVTTSAGCTGTSNAINMTVLPAPVPTIISGPATVCQGTAGNTYITQTGYANYQWVVSAGGLITSGGTASDDFVTVTWNGSGAQSVTVNYEGTNGCSAANPFIQNVTVNPSLPVSVSIVANANPVCPETTVMFTATPVNGGSTPSYQWYKGALPVGSNSPTYTYTPANGDVITCVLTSDALCPTGNPATSNAITMVVNSVLPASVTIVANNNPSCSGTWVTFTATPVNGGSSPTYKWYKGALQVGGTGPSYAYYPANGDIITCVMTSSLLCTTGNPATSNQVTMIVNPHPASPTSGGDQTVCSINLPALLTATAPAGSTVDWYHNASGGSPLLANSSTYSTSTAGTYYAESRELITGCKSTTRTPVNLTINTAVQYFRDQDGDGYGNPEISQYSCDVVAGYVTNGLDCDDSNPDINPDDQYFAFTGNPNFTDTLVYPRKGSASTLFHFEADYFNATNSLPPAGFPRLMLDYEGNGSYLNANDRIVLMTQTDPLDLNTVNGKRYFADVNNLPYGSTYTSKIMVGYGGVCATSFGPFNYPDVLHEPNLYIFANDISFSPVHPDPASPLTISAVVHNEADYDAVNFVCHLKNQWDTSIVYPDVTVPFLQAHHNTTVVWNITTPAVPAWCPMQVTVDYTNVIAENNELDNSAVRPFTNGNYQVAGKIIVTSDVSPHTSYEHQYNYLTLYGDAFYTELAVQLSDSSVAGATVDFVVTKGLDTVATGSTYTNSWGDYSVSFLAPDPVGTYKVDVSVTDFTLTGTDTTHFHIVPYIVITKPNLTLSYCHSVDIAPVNPHLEANVDLIAHVQNNGNATAIGPIEVLFTYSSGYSATVQYPGNLASGHSVTLTKSSAPRPALGTLLTADADPNDLISEWHESDNASTDNMCYDFEPVGLCGGNFWGHNYCLNESTGIYVGLHVYHLYDASPVDVKFEVSGPGIAGWQYLGTGTLNNATRNCYCPYFVSIPGQFQFTELGTYTFRITADPDNDYPECNEGDNVLIVTANSVLCVPPETKPNLAFNGCWGLEVEPENPFFPGMGNLIANVVNSGNDVAIGPILVDFTYSGGTFTGTYNGNLNPGQVVAISVAAPLPVPATTTLTAEIDPLNTVDEWTETDNDRTDDMCWEFQPVPTCYSNFWNRDYLVGQSTTLWIGVHVEHLYDADPLKVKFEVEGPGIPGKQDLGRATLNHVTRTCWCPISAVLEYPYTFLEAGIYTFTMTVDPDNIYTECDESNNVYVVQVTVLNGADMRILSHFINPDPLNPEVDSAVSLIVTYENIGNSNVNDTMSLRVKWDNDTWEYIHGLPGLGTGDHNSVALTTTHSEPIPGAHVIRAIIDVFDNVPEINESNNEATRAIIVGEAANLYFQVFASSVSHPDVGEYIHINTRIGNNGDVNVTSANVRFFYLNDEGDTIPIGITPISVPKHDSITLIWPWVVIDNKTTLIGKITDVNTLEFNPDDNVATDVIGGFDIIITSTPSCPGEHNGTLTANIVGGTPPFLYSWSNGYIGQTLTDTAGTYTVTVTDNIGLTEIATGTITELPIPDPAGPISGVTPVLQGTYDVPYSVDSIANASTYEWAYSGTGVTINGSGHAVLLDFAIGATSGELSVFGQNLCGDGVASFFDISVDVSATPPLPFNVIGSGSYCAGSDGKAVWLSGSETGVTYTLFKNGQAQVPTFAGTGAAMSFGNQLAGTYTASGTNAGGTTSMTGSAVITENPMLTLTDSIAANQNPVCMGQPVTIICTHNYPILSTNWYVNSVFVSNAVNLTYVPANGDQVYCVSWVTQGGCWTSPNATSNTLIISVNPIPAAVAGAPRAICKNTSTTIGAAPVPGSTYSWSSVPAGFASSLANPTVTPLVTTTYTVVETITATGCSNHHSVVVTVYPLPVPSLIGPTPVCNNSTGNVYTTDAGMGSTYVWTIPAGATKTAGGGPSDNTVTITWTTAGTKVLKVSYTNGNGCTAAAPSQYNVTVKPSPVPAINGPASCCANVNTVYSTVPWQTGYSWTISPDGTIVSGQGTKTATVKWTSPGAHWIGLNYTNLNGCSAPAPTIKNVTVNPCKSEVIPGVIVPESQIQLLENEQDEFGPLDLKLYPNPNEGSFTIIVTVPEPDKYNMEIFSNLGVKVYELREVQVDGKLRKTIHVGYVADGVYNFILSNKDKMIQKRVIIRKQH